MNLDVHSVGATALAYLGRYLVHMGDCDPVWPFPEETSYPVILAVDDGALTIDGHFYSFRRYFGIEVSHLQMALYTSRREEMISVVRSTLRYLNADEPIQVHALSSLSSPYQVFFFVNYESKVIRFEFSVLRIGSYKQVFLVRHRYL